MTFPKIKYESTLEIPQEYESFGGLFGPLGLFLYSFVRLERDLSWSYVVSENDPEKLDAIAVLNKVAEFEGTTKNTSGRVSKWFNAIRVKFSDQSWNVELNELKSSLVEMNGIRNRLVHDPSGIVSYKRTSLGCYEPVFHFNQQMKSGEVKTAYFSASDLLQLTGKSIFLKTETRRLTLKAVPTAPNIEI